MCVASSSYEYYEEPRKTAKCMSWVTAFEDVPVCIEEKTECSPVVGHGMASPPEDMNAACDS